MSSLIMDTGKIRKHLESFIKIEISKAGFSHAVVGVSGGIDSALACYLVAGALGSDNVLAVRMPYKTSSQESLDHAQMVIEATGVQSETIPITEIADPLINRFPDITAVRKGNIMARCRMIVLYDRSAAFNGLVVGTGNKTEELLGYTTLFGDSACALNPLGDMYKTQVRQLSRTIGIPEVIISKPPTADLWKGQTDEGELGFTYEEVDKLLFALVNQRKSISECISSGFAETFVKKVVSIIKRNRFKRMVTPIAYLDGNYDFVNDGSWLE
jgi:NAD+ synthase